MRPTHLASALLLAAIHSGAAAAIVVRFDPPVVNAEPGTQFTVRLLADIPNDQPVIGWGVKMMLTDHTLFRQFLGPPAAPVSGIAFVGNSWSPAPNIAVSGVTFGQSDIIQVSAVAFPAPITGNAILLATVRLTAYRNGTSDLRVYDERAMGNNSTGFALVPPKGFAEVEYRNARINIPAPSAAVLAVAAAGALARRRR